MIEEVGRVRALEPIERCFGNCGRTHFASPFDKRGFLGSILLRWKIWRRGKTEFFRIIQRCVVAHREEVVSKLAREAGYPARVRYAHTRGASLWTSHPIHPGDILIKRHAFYEPGGVKSVFFHELGHAVLQGGSEAAANSMARQLAREIYDTADDIFLP